MTEKESQNEESMEELREKLAQKSWLLAKHIVDNLPKDEKDRLYVTLSRTTHGSRPPLSFKPSAKLESIAQIHLDNGAPNLDDAHLLTLAENGLHRKIFDYEPILFDVMEHFRFSRTPLLAIERVQTVLKPNQVKEAISYIDSQLKSIEETQPVSNARLVFQQR